MTTAKITKSTFSKTARGHFGRVYIDTRHHPAIAYKVQYALPFSQRRRTIRTEIQLQRIAATHCKYVPRIIDDIVIPKLNHWYIARMNSLTFAMECAMGDTLHNHLSVRRTRFSLLQVHRVMSQLSEAITQLHSIGIVHRDVKNDNLMISLPLTTLRVIDFGLATYSKTPYDANHPLRTSVGTPFNASPQIVFSQPYTAKCDWWSIGIVCYMLLFGMYPFAIRTSDIRNYMMFGLVRAEQRTMFNTPLKHFSESRYWSVNMNSNQNDYDIFHRLYTATEGWLKVPESERMCSFNQV